MPKESIKLIANNKKARFLGKIKAYGLSGGVISQKSKKTGSGIAGLSGKSGIFIVFVFWHNCGSHICCGSGIATNFIRGVH